MGMMLTCVAIEVYAWDILGSSSFVGRSVVTAAQLTFLGGSIAAVALPPVVSADGFDEWVHPSACFWIVLEKASIVPLIQEKN